VLINTVSWIIKIKKLHQNNVAYKAEEKFI